MSRHPCRKLTFSFLASLCACVAAEAQQPVLAYLFTLRRARHPLPHAWKEYFSGCQPGSYRIYIHVDPTFNTTSASEKGPAAQYFKQSYVLPRHQLQKVRRFGHELIWARMKLLRHALSTAAAAGEPPPRFLSFFSESCAPISTCARAHAHLSSAAAANLSFIDNKRPLAPEQVANSPEWVQEFTSVCPRCAAAGILPSHFRFSPGWVTLWHAHAQELVDKESLHDDAISHWGWSKLVNGIPDESYWSTLALKLGFGIRGQLATYMEPGDAKTGHSKMFREGDVDRLWKTGVPNFFARKFPTTPKMDAALSERIKAARATEN